MLGDGWEPPTVVHGVDVLPSRLAVTELALGSVAAAAMAAVELSHARSGPQPRVWVDGRAVSAVFRSDRLARLNEKPIQGFADLSRYWPTRDGWVRTHANYPHHRGRLLAALELAADADSTQMGDCLQRLSAFEAEERVVEGGGIAAAVRSPGEWRRHPQGVAVTALPLLSIERLSDGPPRRLPKPPQNPLLPAAGLRVLDLTRVIAGPVATATLALLGAEVLRVDPPHMPELPEMYVLNAMGKRSTLLDIDRDRQALDRLLADTDVVVTGYRPGALDSRGLGPRELAITRPGLVVATLSAWGGVGPWGSRRGFDSIVQAASGIAVVESDADHKPGALPAQALDYATGFLLAAGVLTAIARQQSEGGSQLVQAHLARTASWLLDHPDDTARILPDATGLFHESPSPYSQILCPRPALRFHDAPTDWPSMIPLWGSSSAAWGGD